MKLNATPEAYKEFYGANVTQMPKLVAEGRVPMNVSQLMQRRLDFRNGPADVKTAWMDNYFDTGDAVIYHPNGDVKIVRDSQTLRQMTSESQRNSGALVLGEDVYQSLQGQVFEKGKLGTVNNSMSKVDVKSHPVWKFLARDQGLLNDYVDLIFAEGKARFNYAKSMGVYLSSRNGKAPEMRAWFVGWLGDKSDAVGRYDLDCGSGRLVGVAPEALGASGNGASNVRAYTMADIQTARAELEALSQVRPELLKCTKSLLGKL
jgi:hypothetical protein